MPNSHYSKAVVRRCSVKKVFLEILQNSQESTSVRDSFLIKLQAFKKESLMQVLSCEFCRISKNTFFTEHPQWLLLSHYEHFIFKVFSKQLNFSKFQSLGFSETLSLKSDFFKNHLWKSLKKIPRSCTIQLQSSKKYVEQNKETRRTGQHQKIQISYFV